MTNATTDAELLEAAILKAGSVALLELALQPGPSRVTIWRWRTAGVISKERDRVMLRAYVERPA